MPFSATNFAKGLLSLLGAQTMGKGISQCRDDFQPTLDCREFLGANQRMLQYATTDDVTSGHQFFVVPAGEMWRVKAGSIVWETGNAEEIVKGVLYILPPESPLSAAVFCSDPVDLEADLSDYRAWLWPDLILTPGTIVGAALGRAGTPNASVRLYTEVLRT